MMAHEIALSLHEHPIVSVGRALLLRPTGNRWRDPLPSLVAQNQTILRARDSRHWPDAPTRVDGARKLMQDLASMAA